MVEVEVAGMSDDRLGVDRREQVVGRRRWAGAAAADRLADGVAGDDSDRGEAVLIQGAGVAGGGLEAGDRVAQLPVGDLLAGPVAVLVALGMALPAVGDRFDQRRAGAGA